MKRIPYLLLITAFVVPVGSVHAETMAERKQRIMRKYLRERQNMVQSDLQVPDAEEDERISASEKFITPEIDLRAQPPSRPLQALPFRPVPMQEQQHWMLEKEEDADTDPYADPFALNRAADREEESVVDRWMQWKTMQDEQKANQEANATDSFLYGGQGGYLPGGEPGYGQGGGTYGARPDPSSRSLYGRSPRTSYGAAPGSGLDASGTTRYGSSPPEGMLQWTTPSPGAGNNADPAAGGYTPYRSPYQMQQQQQPPPGGLREEQQDFIRPTPYQKWKKESQNWDPTADDAYLNDLMKRNRR